MTHLLKNIEILLLVAVISSNAMLAQNLQPEVSSFEEFNTNDLVNYQTGDFVYNMPILHIPGINKGFDVNMMYHSGIKNNQQSSWVGLGWNINPGSIVRATNGYPDDFNGEHVEYKLHNKGVQSYHESIIIYNHSYNSNKGHNYNINLFGASVSWGDYGFGGSMLGFSTYDDDPFWSPLETIYGVAGLMATAGAEDGATRGLESVLGDELKSQIVPGLVQSAIVASQSGKLANSPHLWSSTKTTSILGGIYLYRISQDVHLNANVDQYIYGPLYSHNLPYDGNADEINLPCPATYPHSTETLNKVAGLPIYWSIPRPTIWDGTININKHKGLRDGEEVSQNIHDAHMYVDDTRYLYSMNPSKLNYDLFNVNSSGISGTIQPYRTEIGSLCTDRFGESKITSGEVAKFHNYKPGFRYLNSLNYYDHHAGFELAANDMGIEYEFNAAMGLRYGISDPYISCYPFEDGSYRGDDSFLEKRLIGGNHIEWYTNEDIRIGDAQLEGFIDYVPPHAIDREQFRTQCGLTYELIKNPINYYVVPGPYKGDGIGGFTITAKNGITYHYALPVYSNREFSQTISGLTDNPTTSTTRNNNRYATNWLLTAITGPDFIDNGTPGPDESDWGYWVKFEYSRYKENNVTRMPWADDNEYMPESKLGESRTEYFRFPSPNSSSRTYTYTCGEIYYLDLIKTSTHTAVLKKSEKEGRDRLLKLDEICLFQNKDFVLEDKNQFIDYLSDIGSATTNDALVYTSKYLKKVGFTYDYSLAPYVDQTEGLLTLNEMHFIFPDESLIFPPYVFYYGNNREYNRLRADGWGMYRQEVGSGMRAPNVLSIGGERTLNYIKTPVGTELRINYEKDTYSSVMGVDVSTAGISAYPEYGANNSMLFTITHVSANSAKISYIGANQIFLNPTVNVGDQILIRDLKVERRTITGPPDLNPADTLHFVYRRTFNGIYNVEDIGYRSITLNISGIDEEMDEIYERLGGDSRVVVSETIIDFKSISNTRGLAEMRGGNDRVSQIELITPDETIKTKYIYTLNSDINGNSSGYCLSEPYECRADLDLYFSKEFKFGIPGSHVQYSKVTILNNYTSATEFSKKTVYNYQAAQTNDFEFVENVSNDQTLEEKHTLRLKHYIIHDRTNRTGRINSVEIFNEYDELQSRTSYSYNENSKYGKITHGTLITEYHNGDNYGGEKYDRMFRTTIIEYPNLLSSITSIGNTNSTTQNFNEEDIDVLSDQYLAEEKVNNVTGEVFRTEIIPAYKVYDDMGPKGLESSNKNMLTQTAASISKKNGRIIGASINTWNNNWNYYNWDGTKQTKGNVDADKVWRKHKTFAWNGVLDSDGSFANFPSVNDLKAQWGNYFAGDGSGNWLKNSEVTTYDHYSTPIEVMDINEDYAATKKDPDNNQTVATAANASYTQFTHCTFEYNYDDTQLGEGGAQINRDYVRDSRAHTGENSYIVLAGQSINFYNIGNSEVQKWNWNWDNDGTIDPITFNVSVWVYGAQNANNCEITGPVAGENMNGFQSGDWILLRKTFKLPFAPGTTVSFGIQNTGSATLFIDDFRVAPEGSAVTAYTYDYAGNVTSILNTDNFATTYTYDAAGRLIETHVEKPTGFEKVAANKYHYERLLDVPEFLISNVNPLYDEEVVFTAQNLVEGYTYTWDFNDYSYGEGETVSHTYLEANRKTFDTYDVILTVTDQHGKSGTTNKRIVVPYIKFVNTYSGTECFYGSNPFDITSSDACYQLTTEWEAIQEGSSSGGIPVGIHNSGPICGVLNGETYTDDIPKGELQEYNHNVGNNFKYIYRVHDSVTGITLETPAVYYFPLPQEGDVATCIDNKMEFNNPGIPSIDDTKVWIYGDPVTIEYVNIPCNFMVALVKNGLDQPLGSNSGAFNTSFAAGSGSIEWVIDFPITNDIDFTHDMFNIIFTNDPSISCSEVESGSEILERSSPVEIWNPSLGISLDDLKVQYNTIDANITLYGVPEINNTNYRWEVLDYAGIELTSGVGKVFSFTPLSSGEHTINYSVEFALADGPYIIEEQLKVSVAEPDLNITLPSVIVRGYSMSVDINLSNIPNPYDASKEFGWEVNDYSGYYESVSGDTRNINYIPPSRGSYTLTYWVEIDIPEKGKHKYTKSAEFTVVGPSIDLTQNDQVVSQNILFNCSGVPSNYTFILESNVPWSLNTILGPGGGTDFYTVNPSSGTAGTYEVSIEINNVSPLGTSWNCATRFNYFQVFEVLEISSAYQSDVYFVQQTNGALNLSCGTCDDGSGEVNTTAYICSPGTLKQCHGQEVEITFGNLTTLGEFALYNNDDGIIQTAMTDIKPNSSNGTVIWTIPDNLPVGNNYYVKHVNGTVVQSELFSIYENGECSSVTPYGALCR